LAEHVAVAVAVAVADSIAVATAASHFLFELQGILNSSKPAAVFEETIS
jgi:hypothetical protein